jgi:Xaa-Pro aminopeptidase
MSTKTPPPLLYASTHTSADMLYFGGVDVHDAFIAFGDTRGRRITVQSALELGRVKKSSRFHTVLPGEECRKQALARFKGKAGVAEIIVTVARDYGIRRFRVPADFPTQLYLKLIKLGLKLEVVEGMLFPEREIKTPQEVAAIREGNRLCSVGFTVAENILRASRIKGRTLVHRGEVVTSESLRFAIETAIMAQGGRPADTIVAGGDQACDPHDRGSGPLRPHELIIIDIFPRVVATGYHGDMTRTYLKGRPREVQRRMVETVRQGQKLALKAIRAGAVSSEIHGLITDCFTAAGYETKHGKNGSVGYFHGTGHGLGLAVHDPGDGISGRSSAKLKAGAVLTVEPGLYYPGLGGCRWEDVVQVTNGPAKLLSRHPYNWEIR